MSASIATESLRNLYAAIMRHRVRRNLLKAFFCAVCGEIGFDPVEKIGRGKWVCSRCADCGDAEAFDRFEAREKGGVA